MDAEHAVPDVETLRRLVDELVGDGPGYSADSPELRDAHAELDDYLFYTIGLADRLIHGERDLPHAFTQGSALDKRLTDLADPSRGEVASDGRAYLAVFRKGPGAGKTREQLHNNRIASK